MDDNQIIAILAAILIAGSANERSTDEIDSAVDDAFYIAKRCKLRDVR